jgi:AcrR family transcriptional regulator
MIPSTRSRNASVAQPIDRRRPSSHLHHPHRRREDVVIVDGRGSNRSRKARRSIVVAITDPTVSGQVSHALRRRPTRYADARTSRSGYYLGHMTKASAQDVTRRTRGQATRAALIEAACELIPEAGWGSVTTRGVAERAGVLPGLVHYHFHSVEALLVAAATRASDGLVDEARGVLDAAPDIATGIDGLVAATAAVADEGPAMLLLTEASLAAARIPRLRSTLATALADLRTLLARWLQDRGHDGDADATATVITAALDGWALHRAADPSLDIAPFRDGLRALATVGAEGSRAT